MEQGTESGILYGLAALFVLGGLVFLLIGAFLAGMGALSLAFLLG